MLTQFELALRMPEPDVGEQYERSRADWAMDRGDASLSKSCRSLARRYKAALAARMLGYPRALMLSRETNYMGSAMRN